MGAFRGSTQEKRLSHIFRFGYRKTANDKMVPDRVGSGLLLAGTITAEGFHRFLTIDVSVRTLMKWRPLCETGIDIRSGRTSGGLRGAHEIRLDKVVAVLIP
jgi:hypothetical protein